MNRLGKILILILWLGLSPPVGAQQAPADDAGLPLPEQTRRSGDLGLPYPSNHFAPPQYQQYPQNWSVTQDHRGIVYAANNYGILEYDGNSWRLIPTPDTKIVRSLTTAEDGAVYAGTFGDFGMLQPDSVGVMQYVSLSEHIPEVHRNFKNVWGTHATSEGVYFQSNERLFRWDGAAIDVWTSNEGFHTAFAVRGELYVRDFEKGLLRMVGDSLRLVPDGDRFADMPVPAMVPLPDGRILIGTDEDGLYVYDGQTVRPFDTEAQPFLDEYELYHGCALSNGQVALATLGGGVLIIDQAGNLVRVLGPSAELPDGVVHHVYQDSEGGLWMAFNSSGLARVEVASPLSKFDQRLGLEGLVYSIARHDGDLYVATGTGLFVLETHPLTLQARQQEEYTSFRRVSGIPIAWDLASTPDGLLVATDRGVFVVRGDQYEQLTQGASRDARTIDPSDHYPGWYFVGERGGLRALHQTPGGWEKHPVTPVDEQMVSIVEGPEGDLWANSAEGNILRLRFPDGPASNPVVERIQQEGTLPPGFNRVTSLAGELLIISKSGVFDVRTQAGRQNMEKAGASAAYEFVRDDRFQVEGNDGPLLSLFEADNNDTWMLRGDQAYRGARRSDGTYSWNAVEALHFPKAEENPLFIDKNGVVWIGNGRDIIRYDPLVSSDESDPFPVHIRKVTTLQDQRVLYGGATPPEASTQTNAPLIEVVHQSNDLQFDFAAAHYGNVAPLEYQYRLKERDAQWSEWQSSTNVVYSNLPEGRYTFRVRARSGANRAREAAMLSFRVLPPWYRTAWAYMAYMAAVLVLGLGYRRYRSIMKQNERAKEQAKELERERMANERLQEANRRLKQANELKDNFLANTSHELRTPLTTILGFADVLKEEAPEQHQEFLDIIEKSGHRLLRTLNAMLDLAKLRSGVAEADLSALNVVDKSAEVIELFRHDARRKGIDLELDAPNETVYAALDARYYEQILDNLVSNAIKFTDEGRVRVEIDPSKDEVAVRVHDTGAGIDAAFIPYLFDDFKQESSGLNRDHEGSGLGLAITKRLVNLMGGTIDVESTKGEGSTFTVTFPSRTEAPSTVRPVRTEPTS